MTELHFVCRDPLFSTSFGMIMRKYFPYAEMINIEIMRYYAFGLRKVSDKLKRNDGILGSRRESCHDIVPPAVCKLSPEAGRDIVKRQV